MASRSGWRRDVVLPRWVRPFHRCWKPLAWIWAAIFLSAFINVGSSWLITKHLDLGGTPLGWGVDHPWITLPPLLLLVLLTLLARLASLQEHAVPPASPLTLTAKQRLQFIRGFEQEYTSRLVSSLQGQATLELHLQERTDVIASSASLVFHHLETGEVFPLPPGTSILQAYDRVQRGILLLGAPGSGKTTLLLELARELLQRAENDPDQPLAIILNLSNWARTQLPLAQWLGEQCSLVYGIPKHLSAAWIAQEQVQFLLDGLDEMGASARKACIEAINTYRQAHLVPLVVCSRSQEYGSQAARLILPGAVEIQPLELAQVSQVLKQAGKSLAAVRAALRSNAILSDLLTTLLMLSIVMLAYRGKMVKDLPQLGSAEDQQRQVFAHYVTRMLEQPTREWRYAADSTQKWVIWLAQQMKQRQLTEFYLERLQPTWLADQPTQKIHTWIFRLVVGLAFGLTTGLVFGLVVGLAFAWFYGLRSGLLGGLLSWLFFGSVGGLLDVLVGGLNENFWKKLLSALVVGTVFALLSGLVIGLVSALLVMLYEKDQEIQVADRLTLSWKHFWKKLPYGLALGLLIGLVGWWLSGPEVGLVTSLLGGLLLWLIIGLKGGLGSIQIAEDKRITPNQGIQNSGQNALRIGLMCMLGVGLLGGLTYGLLNGLATGLIDSLLDGLMAGLIFGQAYGGGSYLQHYVLRYQLWRSGAMPWHYIRFLDEATERVLLQRVGGGYRFIHPLLQDYFASLGTGASANARTSLSSLVKTMEQVADDQRDRESAASVLQGKRATQDFDVFLCHNGQDKPAVKQLGKQLESQGILPWLDEWELRPGLPWQQLLEQQAEMEARGDDQGQKPLQAYVWSIYWSVIWPSITSRYR